jgi:hypothetical protein
MTQAEKDLVEAPRLAEQQRQEVFTTELASNDACNADMDTLASRIDTAYASASNVSQVKAVTVALIKKLARCVRARARE